MIGRRLSHYRIEERLGAGGMGEVYRARDEKLGRDVALKVLPSGALADDEARRRFHKEAAVLARLSHPHIATLFDFDSADGIDFLVMELVVGPTLERELRKGPLAEKDVVRLGSQLARGLQAAHEQGIVHRDLKPSNLQLTADGLLKILDFGVAHLERGGTPTGGEATATETGAGEVLGSPPYMAPEQLLGKAVDARTDLYAAGTCLYELATGKRPYGTKRGAPLTEAILHELPASPRSVNGGVSPGLEAVILKALDKDPGLRYQTARELLVDLERLQAVATSGDASQPVAVSRSRRRLWPWLAAVAGLGAITAATWHVRQSAPPRLLEVRAVTSGLDASTMTPGFGSRSWATDGSRLYFVGMKDGRSALFQVPVTGGEPAEIPVPFESRKAVFGYAARQSAILMGGSPEAESSVAVSPDGWPLWMIPVASGAPRRVGSFRAVEAALSRDGEWIALLQSTRLLLARYDGTGVRVLTDIPRSYGAFGLRWSPDDRTLRYTAEGCGSEGSAGHDWIWELTIDSGRTKALWRGSSGDWSSDGRHYFFQRRNVVARRSDLWVVRERSWLPWHRSQPVRFTLGPLDFDGVGAGPEGRSLYSWGKTFRGELQRVDPKTGRLTPFVGGLSAADLAVSADGRWLTYVAFPEGTLWRARADGSERLQLTTAPLSIYLPRFSPDGKRIVFVGRGPEESGNSIRVVSVSGGDPEVLAPPSGGVASWWDVCWLPDGQSLVSSGLSVRQPGLFRIDARTREIRPLRGAERLLWPKCRWQGGILALEPASDASAGRMVAHVFWPEQETLGPALEFSLGYPNWTRDGKAIVGRNDATHHIERYWFETGRSETFGDISGIPLEGLMPAPWAGLGPDDEPLLLRSHDTWELYALDWGAP